MQAFRYSRQRQPQGPVGIDWGNPICKDLVMVVSGDRTWSSTSGQLPLTAVNTPAPTVSTVGKTMGFGTTDAGNTNSYFTGAVLPGITKGARSGIAVILPRSAGGGNIGRVFNNAAGTGIDVANSEGLWMDASNRLLITACATTGTCQTGFTGITLGVWQTVGFSQDRTVINSIPTSFYINGAASTGVGVNNTNSGSFTSAPQNITIGNRPSDTARTWDGQIALIAYFDRLLSNGELASLTTNPWQIFTPVPRRFSVAAAGPLIIRPAGDTTTTGWTSTGANFYDQINEVTYNDTNYITSPDLNSSPGPYTWTITPTPLAAGTWDVSVRCSDVASSGQIRIRFLDAGSSSVGVSSYQTVTGAFATQTHTVVTSASAVYGVIEVAP